MSKPKTKTNIIRTREELEAAMTDYSEKHARLAGMVAALDVEIAQVRENHQAEISAATEALDEAEAGLGSWAALNPGEFAAKKSIDLIAGRIGFRTTPPAVALLKGVKAEAAIAMLLDGELAALYTREAVTLDKEAILADHATGKVTDAQLRAHGLKVKQEERFFVEPAATKADA
jgi:phage host-nuclease inhibitor protein Gam